MYTMKEACQAVGMPYETLKFYCNEGLVPNVKRDANQHRLFDERDIEWIKSLTCLKSCGMSIQEMRRYIALCLQGMASLPERKEILARKREELLGRIAQLEKSIAFIDWKQQLYDDFLAGRKEYISNLLPREKE